MIYRHAGEREAIAQAIEATWPESQRLEASSRHACWADIEDELAARSVTAPILQVLGLERWLDVDADLTLSRLGQMNLRRDGFAARVPRPVLLWLTPASLHLLTREAVDLWSWRSVQLEFLDESPAWTRRVPASKDLGMFLHLDVDDRAETYKRQRIEEWQRTLRAASTPLSSLSAFARQVLLRDLADHLTSLGDWDAAQDMLLKGLIPELEAARSTWALADAKAMLADVCQASGRFEQAVNLRQDQMRLLRQTKSRQSHEVAQTALALCLRMSGDIVACRRIWEKEFLPTYIARGNLKYQAFTKAEIVRCLLATERPNDNDLKDAERVLRDEVLPTLPDLAGERATAITFDLLADVLERQGELDDALRIRRREVIPLLAVSKDIRLMAWVACKVADGFAQQGRFEDAIALRADEAIPVFQYLGDKPALAVVEADQAINRTALADMNAALAAMRGECGESTFNPDRT
jgi:tetratricopeptide (TPR) repeat protein